METRPKISGLLICINCSVSYHYNYSFLNKSIFMQFPISLYITNIGILLQNIIQST